MQRVVGLLMWLAFALPMVAVAQPELPKPPPTNLPSPQPVPAPAILDIPGISVPVLSLPECVAIALQRQPTIAAARASLLSAEIGFRTLDGTRRIVKLAAPDIEFRKQQAMKGVAAAQAELNQMYVDTIYNVSRNYWTAVYAKIQYDLAEDTSKKLRTFLTTVKDVIKEGGSKKITPNTADTLTIYLAKVEEKREEAGSGIKRALAALREAMGVEYTYIFDVKDRTLPRVVMPLTREETIILATTRRGEVIQAAIATDVFRLEICAQGAIRFRPATRTFAMGADIHAKATPLGNRGSEYRPDAIGLEMPPAFAGKKEDRMDKATALSMRADAVYAKTVNLITLEAENSYLLWEEVQRKLVPSEMGYKAAASYRKRSEDDPDTPRSEDLVVGEVLVAQAFSGYNDVLYQAILAIVSLERVTGGGYRADFTHVPPPEEKNGNGKNGNGEEKKDDKDEKKNDK